MSKYPKHDKVVDGATRDVGVKEEPLGSNSGARVKTYQASTWLGGTGWPWCVAFIQYHWQRAGFLVPWRGAGAYALLDWARTVGWTCRIEDAVPGDAVVFNVGTGHAGLYHSHDQLTVKTIDGNVANRVDYRSRSRSTIRGIVHIPEQAAVVPPPVKEPIYEVVTSADGRKRVVFVGKGGTIQKKLGRFLNRHGGVEIRKRKRRPPTV